MPYRLPIELELTILELAAPLLAIDSLHDRVAFFTNVSLVHRSFTAWAQERLHDQFLYTYRPHEDEYARLERGLTEAGFGPSRPIKRLYLNATQIHLYDLPAAITPPMEKTAEGLPTSNEGLQSSEGLKDVLFFIGRGVFGRRLEAPDGPAFRWTLKPLLAQCVQSLHALWLKQPFECLDLSDIPAPRLLESDDSAFRTEWRELAALPLSRRTTLVLRDNVLSLRPRSDHYPVLNLILDKCVAYAMPTLLTGFAVLEVFIACETFLIQPGYGWLPASIRHIHIIQRRLEELDRGPAPAATFPALKSFTLTWLQPVTSKSGSLLVQNADPLPNLRRHVEATIIAPRCTFKYLRSTKSPEDALADAMADLGLDS